MNPLLDPSLVPQGSRTAVVHQLTRKFWQVLRAYKFTGVVVFNGKFLGLFGGVGTPQCLENMI